MLFEITDERLINACFSLFFFASIIYAVFRNELYGLGIPQLTYATRNIPWLITLMMLVFVSWLGAKSAVTFLLFTAAYCVIIYVAKRILGITVSHRPKKTK